MPKKVKVSKCLDIKLVLSRSRPEPIHLGASCSSICCSHAACQPCMFFAVGRAVDDQDRGWRLSFHTIDIALFASSDFATSGFAGFLHLPLVIGLCLLWLDLWFRCFVLCLQSLPLLGLRRCRLTSLRRFQLGRTRILEQNWSAKLRKMARRSGSVNPFCKVVKAASRWSRLSWSDGSTAKWEAEGPNLS